MKMGQEEKDPRLTMLTVIFDKFILALTDAVK